MYLVIGLEALLVDDARAVLLPLGTGDGHVGERIEAAKYAPAHPRRVAPLRVVPALGAACSVR